MNKKIWCGRITLSENVVDIEYIIDIVGDGIENKELEML